jgi:hypothetical protein
MSLLCCGSLEAVWNESCDSESCALHMTRNGLYLHGDLSIRRSLVQLMHSVNEPAKILQVTPHFPLAPADVGLRLAKSTHDTVKVQGEVRNRWAAWRDYYPLNQLRCFKAHCTNNLEAILYVPWSKLAFMCTS